MPNTDLSQLNTATRGWHPAFYVQRDALTANGGLGFRILIIRGLAFEKLTKRVDLKWPLGRRPAPPSTYLSRSGARHRTVGMPRYGAASSPVQAPLNCLLSDICLAIGGSYQPAGAFLSNRSDALQLLLRPRIVLVSARLPHLGTPSQVVIFHGNFKQPVSGFAVSERFRFLSRCFRTGSPVVGLVEFTFRIHAASMQFADQRNATAALRIIT